MATHVPTPSATQTIFRFRRDYNSWVADETMEDYALRYTPKSFRKWSEFRVANTAFGSLSFLALEAIGGAIALNYGFSNAMWAIAMVGLVIFLTSFPIAFYAARYGLDLDLLTRGAGFGYLGSTITSLIYAVFTFIFFALEAAIMALALQLVLDWPLAWCYLLSSLVVLPLALKGITLISKLQTWTQGPWLFLLVWPFVWIAFSKPELYHEFTTLSGLRSGSSSFDPMMFGAAAAVGFSLVVQIGEQVDFLRFLPERTEKNRRQWWTAVLIAGPGWILMGMLKMLGGAFLAFAALQFEVGVDRATEPTQMFLAGFTQAVGQPGLAVLITVVFVVLSQVKINITNAYAGSLAWSNFFARVTRSHPGRVVWLMFNVGIATLLMILGVFGALEKVLAVYSNVAIAWIGALVADLVINKPLGWSPQGIEFRRAYLFDFNPVGLGAMVAATVVGWVAYAGVFGPWLAAFSPLLALLVAMLVSPCLAWATKGKFYLARTPEVLGKPGELLRCAVCENQFEAEDMAGCAAYAAPICSLCCSLESRCHDRCKVNARASDQLKALVFKLIPHRWVKQFNFRGAHYLGVTLFLCLGMGGLLGVVFVQESLSIPADVLVGPMLKSFALLSLFAAVCGWWVVLSSDSRRMAQDESERQTQLLQKEIEAHEKTDAELQAAKDLADSANLAKTRYVAGMTHELRSPLNSILGYTHILLKSSSLDAWARETLQTIQQSGHHMQALIDESLDLARIEAGRLRLDRSPVSLTSFIEQVEQMLRPQVEAKGLSFTVSIKGTVPAWVRIDPKWLRQILINLLTNAIRFTERGGISLKFDFTQHVTKIEIQDTGIGIEPHDFDRIFLPFERGSAGRKSRESGTGLGLTITLLLVNLMGGDLKVSSVVNQGTTFALQLYFPSIAPDPSWEKTQATHLKPIIGYLAPKRTLLVVDDQALQRQLLAGMLLPLGFVVQEAASGSECMEIVQRSKPDAVLLDLSMDEMDGWETLAELRKIYSSEQLPAIIVSANLFDQRADQYEQLHCQGFLGKPTAESELLGALEKVLEIEWLRDNTPQNFKISAPLTPASSALSVPAQTLLLSGSDTPAELPMAWLEDVGRFARQGQGGAIRDALRQARIDHPHHSQILNLMQTAADRFDFDALLAIVREQMNNNDPTDDLS
jgi:signal transduction histidine kinase/CheY-like chemotaxis protein/purine-cytosine permease-like protein